MIGIFWIGVVIACVQAFPEQVDIHKGNLFVRHVNIEGRIARDGYYSESHNVITSDGYILEVNRIPLGRHENKDDAPKVSKPVVFLMHGLQSSALAYITLNQYSIAYNLADSGYDVWMGNARGVINSRNHVYLNPDNPDDTLKFFDYTFEDVGMKDLPVMIDYVLANTGQSQLHYIGHSQGGTAFLVMTSMFPEYNQVIKSAHLLAGVGYQDHFPNRLLRVAARITNNIYEFAVSRGVIEILGPDGNSPFAAECKSEGNKEVCGLLDIMDIVDELTKYLEMIGGSSIKQYAHYGQNIKDKKFRRWNFENPRINLQTYGRFTPPEFDISKITTDVTMHYTVGDTLLDEEDVLAMAAVMPNTKVRKVARDSFSHTDFVIALDAKELVTDYIIEQLKKYDS